MAESDPRPWRRDPVVWAGALFGGGATAWAVFAERYLPYIDWSNHLALISVLAHGGSTGALDFYTRSLLPSPYLLFYALTALFAQVVAVDVGAKVVLVLAGAALALGAASLAEATGRSPRLGLVAPLGMFGISMGWGFASFVVATPLFLFALAATERVLAAGQGDLFAPRRVRARPTAELAVWLALVYLAHGFLFFVAVAAIGARAILWSTVRLRHGAREAILPSLSLVVAGIPGVLLMLPSLVLLVGTPSVEAGIDPNARVFEFTPLAQRLAGLGGDLLERGSSEHWKVMYGAAALFFVWLVVSLLRPHPRSSARATSLGLEIYALLLTALYLFGPMAVQWPSSIWMIYPRFGVVAAILLLLVPRPDLRGPIGLPLALFGLVLTGWNAELNARHVREFSADAHRYDGVRSAIPPGQRVFALTVLQGDEAQERFHALGSLYDYLMVDGASYVAFLFDKNELPVHLRRDRAPPRAPVWNAPWSYDPKTHGVDYDYLVLRGRELIKRTEEAGLHERVAEFDSWVVFKTKSPTPRGG